MISLSVLLVFSMAVFPRKIKSIYTFLYTCTINVKIYFSQAPYNPLTGSPLRYNEKIKLLNMLGYIFVPSIFYVTIKLRDVAGV